MVSTGASKNSSDFEGGEFRTAGTSIETGFTTDCRIAQPAMARLRTKIKIPTLAAKNAARMEHPRIVFSGLGTRYLLPGAGYFHAVRAGCVARDAFVQRFGDLFAVAVAAEFLFVGGAADEGNFRQDSRHGRFGQDDEAGFFYAAVAQS